MNKKFPVIICPNINAWCNKCDICVISTTDTLSGFHAYQHSFQHLFSYKLPTCSNIPGFTQTSQKASSTRSLTLLCHCLTLSTPKFLSVSTLSDSTWTRLSVNSGQEVKVHSTGLHNPTGLILRILEMGTCKDFYVFRHHQWLVSVNSNKQRKPFRKHK